MACTGIEFCKLSFAETRKRSQVLVPELEKRLEDINAQLDVPITVNINGCPNSCARIQVADIGFKGQMVDDGDGGPVEGFQVHLGGSLGLDSGFGRKLRQHKVLSTELGDYIDRVVRNFVKQREQGERFATWAIRADEADLTVTDCDVRNEATYRSWPSAAPRSWTVPSANDLLRWTDENFGGNYVVASNMQDAVLVDLAAKVRPGVDVLFLDTGYHFVETIGTRDAVEAVYDINVRQRHARELALPSRTSCSARTCSPASPTNAAGCARSSR